MGTVGERISGVFQSTMGYISGASGGGLPQIDARQRAPGAGLVLGSRGGNKTGAERHHMGGWPVCAASDEICARPCRRYLSHAAAINNGCACLTCGNSGADCYERRTFLRSG